MRKRSLRGYGWVRIRCQALRSADGNQDKISHTVNNMNVMADRIKQPSSGILYLLLPRGQATWSMLTCS